MRLYDLHNHTSYSDGVNSVYEISRKFKRKNIRVGICDHYHMIEDKEAYIEELELYDVYKAVEIRAVDILKGNVDYKWIRKNLDYVLIEYIEIMEECKQEQIFSEIDYNIVVPRILAHPTPELLTTEFLKELRRSNMKIELNLLQGNFPEWLINYIKEHNIETTVGSDIHDLTTDFDYQRIKDINMFSYVLNRWEPTQDSL